jgi:hypothetical protein
VAVARVMARLVAVVAMAAGAMSRRWWQCTCAALVEGRWSDNNALFGLRCLAWLALLGLLCLAGIKVRPLTRWLLLRICNAGQRWGGGAATLAAVTMITTKNNQPEGAVEETMAAATVTGSSDDCNSGNNCSNDDCGSDDGGCSDGNGNTNGGSGSIDGNSNGGDCNSNDIAVGMVKAMTAVIAATMAATAIARGTDNNQLKGAWKKQRWRRWQRRRKQQQQRKWQG